MSECASWSAQREALAVEALRGSGQLRLQVSGESMLPTLWPGDIVEIESCRANEVGHGEIVLAWHDGRFFLHRFLAGRESGFITRGDSMPGPDPAFAPDAILGRLRSVHRNGRQLELRRRPWTRALGLLFCYSGLARRAVLAIRGGKPKPLPAADLKTA
jgi:hypothetical protein